MTSWCAASFQKLKFNTKHTIYSPFLKRCSFKCVILIQIRGHAVTYRSAVCHTVSRDANSQARVHQVGTLECSEMQNLSHGLAFAYECQSMERKVQCDRALNVISQAPPTNVNGHCCINRDPALSELHSIYQAYLHARTFNSSIQLI